ncbi:hypothetical protein BJ741DRAFT_711726 [Chytriomyces cf. hyalinus JEL632]|nr:hypothetical protein BJ741DRAFT_711726 [Chytriomyces cf. hyalinus JEL632]
MHIYTRHPTALHSQQPVASNNNNNNMKASTLLALVAFQAASATFLLDGLVLGMVGAGALVGTDLAAKGVDGVVKNMNIALEKSLQDQQPSIPAPATNAKVYIPSVAKISPVNVMQYVPPAMVQTICSKTNILPSQLNVILTSVGAMVVPADGNWTQGIQTVAKNCGVSFVTVQQVAGMVYVLMPPQSQMWIIFQTCAGPFGQPQSGSPGAAIVQQQVQSPQPPVPVQQSPQPVAPVQQSSQSPAPVQQSPQQQTQEVVVQQAPPPPPAVQQQQPVSNQTPPTQPITPSSTQPDVMQWITASTIDAICKETQIQQSDATQIIQSISQLPSSQTNIPINDSVQTIANACNVPVITVQQVAGMVYTLMPSGSAMWVIFESCAGPFGRSNQVSYVANAVEQENAPKYVAPVPRR